MSEEQSLELTDEQREEVRQMLAKFSNQKDKKTKRKAAQKKDQETYVPDPLEAAKPGTTIEWTELTPKTRRYQFVREAQAFFVPLLLDKICIAVDEIHDIIAKLGMDIQNENESLIVCSVTQADPVRVFQIQMEPQPGGKLVVNTIRFIV